MTAEGGRGTPGILIALDVLIIQRADEPHALDDAALALRRIGWMGRPIILVGETVAGRSLPAGKKGRERWVRGELGAGAYSVVPFDEHDAPRQEEAAVGTWTDLQTDHDAGWLVTDRARDVAAARKAGLKTIVVGPPDPQPLHHRPDYRARDLRDAVGHLLAVDVFSERAGLTMFG